MLAFAVEFFYLLFVASEVSAEKLVYLVLCFLHADSIFIADVLVTTRYLMLAELVEMRLVFSPLLLQTAHEMAPVFEFFLFEL